MKAAGCSSCRAINCASRAILYGLHHCASFTTSTYLSLVLLFLCFLLRNETTQVEWHDAVVLLSPKWRQYVHVSAPLTRRTGEAFREVNAAPVCVLFVCFVLYCLFVSCGAALVAAGV